ncbi:MAG: hypothetical protein AB1758_27655 [Candidatus Eremiobacterota bacterium]
MPNWNPICTIGPNNPTPAGCGPATSLGIGAGVPGSGRPVDLNNSPDQSPGFNPQDTVSLSSEARE